VSGDFPPHYWLLAIHFLMVSSPLESYRNPGRSGFARAGSVPYHQLFESGGGSGAPGRKHTPADQKQERGTAAQAYALGITTPLQPGTRAGSAKAQCPARQQAGHRTAWDLKETFSHFWRYKSVIWAGAFLDYWCFRAMRSRLEPMKRVARMLRTHEPLLLNWFRAEGEISNGAVEGLNNKIRVVTRRSYGFRTFQAMEIALYHNLGRLPEPESTHRFC
jgi:hypothetical protein